MNGISVSTWTQSKSQCDLILVETVATILKGVMASDITINNLQSNTTAIASKGLRLGNTNNNHNHNFLIFIYLNVGIMSRKLDQSAALSVNYTIKYYTQTSADLQTQYQILNSDLMR